MGFWRLSFGCRIENGRCEWAMSDDETERRWAVAGRVAGEVDQGWGATKCWKTASEGRGEMLAGPMRPDKTVWHVGLRVDAG